MLAVDTNVLVRLAIVDDPEQTGRAVAALRGRRFFITTTVLLETEWVLRSSVRPTRPVLLALLERIVGQEGAVVQNAEAVWAALDDYAAGVDFADALHVRGVADCDAFLTFDRKLIRTAADLNSVPVREP